MANHCYNEFTVKCSNSVEAHKVLAALNNMYSKDIVYIDDCMKQVGIRVPKNMDYRDHICAEATQNNEDATVIYFTTESAWSPRPNSWKHLIQRISPTAKVYFYAEEPGQGIFQTNNPDYFDKYYVDIFLDKEVEGVEEGTNLCSKEEVISILQKLLRTSNDDIEDLLTLAEETDWGDNGVYIYPIDSFDFMDYDY